MERHNIQERHCLRRKYRSSNALMIVRGWNEEMVELVVSVFRRFE